MRTVKVNPTKDYFVTRPFANLIPAQWRKELSKQLKKRLGELFYLPLYALARVPVITASARAEARSISVTQELWSYRACLPPLMDCGSPSSPISIAARSPRLTFWSEWSTKPIGSSRTWCCSAETM